MKQLIDSSEILGNNLRGQFYFVHQNYAYWGIVSAKGIWYKCKFTTEENDIITVLPVPKGPYTRVMSTNLLVPEDTEKPSYYPYDPTRLAKMTKEKILQYIEQSFNTNEYSIKCDKTLRSMGKQYLIAWRDCMWLLNDNEYTVFSHRHTDVETGYMIDIFNSTIADINLNGCHDIKFTIPKGCVAPLLCNLIYDDYKVVTGVAYSHDDKNKKYGNFPVSVTTDKFGELDNITKEKIMTSMMNKLGKLTILGEEKSTVEQEATAKVEKDTQEFIESLKQSMNMPAPDIKLKTTVINLAPEESDKVIPMTVSDRVIPMTAPTKNVTEDTQIHTKNVIEDTQTPMKNVTGESETVSSVVEEVPVTIDSLRMELTTIKTSISLFDKHLREFAKTGACSKKIQDELTKCKNENIKLREEVKRLKEDAEKFEKVMKYVATLDK